MAGSKWCVYWDERQYSYKPFYYNKPSPNCGNCSHYDRDNPVGGCKISELVNKHYEQLSRGLEPGDVQTSPETSNDIDPVDNNSVGHSTGG